MIDGDMTLLLWYDDDHIENWTDAEGYYQEWTEGPYRAGWRLVEGGSITKDDLVTWYHTAMLLRVSAYYGGAEVWRGYVSELSLTADGITRTMSIDGMANTIKFRYTDEYDDAEKYIVWMRNAESVERFGSLEMVMEYNGKSAAMLNPDGSIRLVPPGDNVGARYTTVHQRADRELNYRAFPQLRSVSSNQSGETGASLTVTAVGAIELDNMIMTSDGWLPDSAVADSPKFADPDDPDYDPVKAPYIGRRERNDGNVLGKDVLRGDPITVSDEIVRCLGIIKAAGGRIYGNDITPNLIDTRAGTESRMGIIDHIRDLSRLGDVEDKYYRISLSVIGGLSYFMDNDTEPEYIYLRGIGIVTLGGQFPRWEARPGYIQFPGERINATQTNINPQVYFAQRVVMRDGNKSAEFYQEAITIEEIANMQLANAQWIEQADELRKPKKKSGSSSTSGSGSPWAGDWGGIGPMPPPPPVIDE